MNRRTFLKETGLLSAMAATGAQLDPISAAVPAARPVSASKGPGPTPQQRRWMDLRFGLLIHFGINTYYDMQLSDGTLDPLRFDPTELDTDQWMRTAQAAGMKYVVFVTKHHDGFCNWPTAHTDYSVKATRFRDDVVGEVVRAARNYNLKVGFYYSLWDRHEKTHDTDNWAYVEFMKKQLHELLTEYGPIVELWFDGFWSKQQTGWAAKPGHIAELTPERRLRDHSFIQAWRNEGAYRWQMDHLYQYVKQLQPDCLVLNNATISYPGVPLHPVDICSGGKAVTPTEYQKIWHWQGEQLYLPMQVETTLSRTGQSQFKSGNWFWHRRDQTVASPSEIHTWLDVARAMDANFLLNAGPMASGKLRPEDEQVLMNLWG